MAVLPGLDPAAPPRPARVLEPPADLELVDARGRAGAEGLEGEHDLAVDEGAAQSDRRAAAVTDLLTGREDPDARARDDAREVDDGVPGVRRPEARLRQVGARCHRRVRRETRNPAELLDRLDGLSGGQGRRQPESDVAGGSAAAADSRSGPRDRHRRTVDELAHRDPLALVPGVMHHRLRQDLGCRPHAMLVRRRTLAVADLRYGEYLLIRREGRVHADALPLPDAVPERHARVGPPARRPGAHAEAAARRQVLHVGGDPAVVEVEVGEAGLRQSVRIGDVDVEHHFGVARIARRRPGDLLDRGDHLIRVEVGRDRDHGDEGIGRHRAPDRIAVREDVDAGPGNVPLDRHRARAVEQRRDEHRRRHEDRILLDVRTRHDPAPGLLDAGARRRQRADQHDQRGTKPVAHGEVSSLRS